MLKDCRDFNLTKNVEEIDHGASTVYHKDFLMLTKK